MKERERERAYGLPCLPAESIGCLACERETWVSSYLDCREFLHKASEHLNPMGCLLTLPLGALQQMERAPVCWLLSYLHTESPGGHQAKDHMAMPAPLSHTESAYQCERANQAPAYLRHRVTSVAPIHPTRGRQYTSVREHMDCPPGFATWRIELPFSNSYVCCTEVPRASDQNHLGRPPFSHIPRFEHAGVPVCLQAVHLPRPQRGLT